jgi:hypothetical protein
MDLMRAKKENECRHKLRELMLYIAYLKQNDPSFGATLLAKALYHADFGAYVKLGKPITGADYIKDYYGPRPRLYYILRDELCEGNRNAVLQRITWGPGPPLDKLIPLREPDLSAFTGPEIAFVDAIVEDVARDTAVRASDKTHGHVWNILRLNEPWPYEAAFISDAPPTDGEREIARILASGERSLF